LAAGGELNWLTGVTDILEEQDEPDEEDDDGPYGGNDLLNCCC
jgi:hypothetical protein